MNRYFINTYIDKIEVLHYNSLQIIHNALKDIKKLEKSHNIEIAFREFVENLLGNKLSDKQIKAFLNKRYNGQQIKDYIDIKKDDDGYAIGTKKYDPIFDIYKIRSKVYNKLYQIELAMKMPIINLITLYEGFIRSLVMTDCIDGNYELINNEMIDMTRLVQFNFDEKSIRTYLIEEYCNKKLYGDKKRIREIIKLLEIDCSDCESLIEDFEEIYYRRNMYVHNITQLTLDYQSLPNRIKEEWISKRNRLINNPQYLDFAFNTFKKIILMILIKKYLYKEKNEDCLSAIGNIVFNTYYLEEEYSVSSFAYKLLKNIKWIQPIDRYFYFVNYMVSLKRDHDEDFIAQLNKWKVDTDAPIFQIAKKLVECNYENINSAIKAILKSDDEYKKLPDNEKSFYLIRGFIESWPLFKEYRETEHYKLLFE